MPFLALRRRDPHGSSAPPTRSRALNARIRRAVKARGHFPNEQAALKCVYLAIISLDPTGRGRQRWIIRWKPALNAFDITFDGRLTAGTQVTTKTSYTFNLTDPSRESMCRGPMMPTAKFSQTSFEELFTLGSWPTM